MENEEHRETKRAQEIEKTSSSSKTIANAEIGRSLNIWIYLCLGPDTSRANERIGCDESRSVGVSLGVRGALSLSSSPPTRGACSQSIGLKQLH